MTELIGPEVVVKVMDSSNYRSGFMLSSELVLTAIVPDEAIAAGLEVKPRGIVEYHECTVVARAFVGTYNVALLKFSTPPSLSRLRLKDVSLGAAAGDGVLSAYAMGFTSLGDSPYPYVMQGALIAEDGGPSTDLILRPDRPIGDNWRGTGGAAVRCGENVLGVLVRFHPTRDEYQAITIKALLEDLTFRKALEDNLGQQISLVQVQARDFSLPVALREVSNADPTNIQQVAATQLALNNLYYENVLKQAARSFTSAVIAATAGLAMFLAVVAISIIVNSSAPAIVGSIGAGLVELISGLNFWLYGRASAQLGEFHIRLERMQRYLVANSACSGLNGDQRDAALSRLIERIASGDQSG